MHLEVVHKSVATRAEILAWGLGEYTLQIQEAAQEGFEMSDLVGNYPITYANGLYQCVMIRDNPVKVAVKPSDTPLNSESTSGAQLEVKKAVGRPKNA